MLGPKGAIPGCALSLIFQGFVAGILACLDGYMNIAMESTEVSMQQLAVVSLIALHLSMKEVEG